MTNQQIDELGIFSGVPRFEQPLHVGRPNIGDRNMLMRRIDQVLDSRWLTNHGPMVGEFESRVAEFLGVEHVVATCNGTITLEILIRALGLTGEVIVPSATFIATAHALQWQEITPVFCDIDPRSHNIDPAMLEKLITPRTSGILGVHLWGRPCDVDALQHLATRHGLRLIFDSSHAFGCTHNGTMVGNFGDAETFSFHATKVVNTFEGGAVATNDEALAKKIRLMTNFGFAGYDEVIYIGTNGKMQEVSAAMGLCSLDEFGSFVERNRSNYEAYREQLSRIPGVQIVRFDEHEQNNFHYVVVEVDDVVTGISRDEIVKVMHGDNIIARRYFYPGCHRMEPYRSYFPHAGLLLGNTEWLFDRVLVLPTGTTVGTDEVTGVCEVLRTLVEFAPEVRDRMSAMASNGSA